MTEAEWLVCQNTQQMLQHLRGKVADRKMRLFVCACCRRVWHLLKEAGRRAVETTERRADGAVDRGELARVDHLAYEEARQPAVYNVDRKRVAALAAWCAIRASS